MRKYEYVPVLKRCEDLFEQPVVVTRCFCPTVSVLEDFGRSAAHLFTTENTAEIRRDNTTKLGVCGDKGSGKTTMSAALLNTAKIRIYYRSLMHNQLLGLSQAFGNICRADFSVEYEEIVGPYESSFGDSKKRAGYPIDPEGPEFHIIEHPDHTVAKRYYQAAIGLEKVEGTTEGRFASLFAVQEMVETAGYDRFEAETKGIACKV